MKFTISNKQVFSSLTIAALAACLFTTNSLSAQNTKAVSEERQPLDLGHSLVEKGEGNLQAGRKLLRDAESIALDANTSLRNNRATYREVLDTQEPSEERASRLASLEQMIGTSLDEMESVNVMLDDGTNLINKGKAQIKNGQLLIQAGYNKTKKSNRAIEFRLMLPDEKPPGLD